MRKLALKLEQKQQLETTLVDPALDQHWNRKFSKQYPLAPVDWLEQNLVTKEIYDHQTEHYGNSVSGYIRNELKIMIHDLGRQELKVRLKKKEHFTAEELKAHQSDLMDLGFEQLKEHTFTVNGPGTCRDMGWVKDANALGFRGIFCEAAAWPYTRARRALLEMGVANDNTVVRMQIRGRPGEIDPNSMFIVESGWKQILSEELMKAQGYQEGRHLRSSMRPLRIFLIHALPKKNPESVVWGEAITNELRQLLPDDFPFQNRGVKWGDSTTYSMREILDPIQEGLGRPVKVLRPVDMRYYHQTYTMMTLVAA